MTGESDVSPVVASQGNQLAPGLCRCGCGRQATKASSYEWSYWCDPAVSDEAKLANRQLGGRRGSMTPAEIARLLEGADLADQSGRQTLRERFLRLRLGGRIGSGVYADVMRALDGAAKDVEKTTTTKASTVVVEVAKYGSNGHNGATE